ncbi:hypothetical protein MFUM_1020004 [Methylacidiphilum fumariolicum SolV]|uniref:Uncharacterized protein n=1 Tax=Methylacidiphilum fumariolicum (strain SolV) TaxID=1156937 RepID=I0JVL3_METFB|nr:hypothetical protein MFUM_1020004 [Methylacidiphilum fumariolicum SolV]
MVFFRLHKMFYGSLLSKQDTKKESSEKKLISAVFDHRQGRKIRNKLVID